MTDANENQTPPDRYVSFEVLHSMDQSERAVPREKREAIMIKVLQDLCNARDCENLQYFCLKYKSELDKYLSSAQTRSWGQFFGSLVPPVTVVHQVDDRTSEKVDMLSETIKNLSEININHKLPIATTEVFLWIALSSLLAIKIKFPDVEYINATIGTLVLFATCMNFERIGSFIKEMFVFKAQTLGNTLVPLIVEGASMLFFGSQLCDLKTFDTATLSKTFVTMNSGTTAMTQYVTKFIDWLESVVTAVADYCGYKIRLGDNIYSKALNEYMEYADLIDARLSDIKRPVASSDETKVRSIVGILYNMCHDLDKKKDSSPTKFTVKLLLDRYRNFQSRIARACPGKGHREAPFFAFITGPPGVGKTVATNLIAKLAVQESLPLGEEKMFEEDPSRYAPYTIPNTDKFWSGFNNSCKVAVMRDVFANSSKEGERDSQANTIIHLVSSEVFPVPQAELADKGNMHFTGDILLGDSNYMGGAKLKDKSINFAPAMDRRLDAFAYSQTVKDGFRKANSMTQYKLSTTSIGEDGFDAYTAKIDDLKIEAAVEAGANYEDIWEFTPWDMTKGVAKGSPIGFYGYCDAFVEAYRANKARNSAINNELSNRFDAYLKSVKSRGQTDMDTFMDVHRAQTKSVVADRLAEAAKAVKDSMMSVCGMTILDTPEEIFAACESYYSVVVNNVITEDDDEFEPSFSDILEFNDDIDAYLAKVPTLTDKIQSYVRTFARLPRRCMKYMVELGVSMTSILTLDSFQYADFACRSQKYFENTMSEYFAAVSNAAVTLYNTMPNVWWVLRSSQFLTFAAGAVVCTAVMMIKKSLAWYSIATDTSFAQTFSNVSQDEKFMNAVINNQVYLAYEVISPTERGTKEMNYGMFLADRHMATVAHCFEYPEYYHKQGHEVFIKVFLMNNVARVIPDFRVAYRDLTFSKPDDKDTPDLIVVNFPLTIKPFARIIDHFPSKDDHSLISMLMSPGGTMKYHMVVAGTHTVQNLITTPEPNRAYFSGGEFQDHFARKTVEMPIKSYISRGVGIGHTADGSCGLMGFATTPALKSLVRAYPKANQPVLASMHVCGNSISGHSMFLYREYFSNIESPGPMSSFDQIQKLTEMHRIALGPKVTKTIPVPRDLALAHAPSNIGQESVMFTDKSATVRKSDFAKNFLYNNEKLEASMPVEEKVYPANRGKIFKSDGTSYNSMDISRKKYATNTGVGLSLKASKMVGATFDQDLLYHTALSSIPLVGDRLEAYKRIIVGSATNGVLARNKSVGPTLSALTDYTTRHDIFGDGALPVLGSPDELALRSVYASMLHEIDNGGDFAVLMRATLKDELRPITRVIAGKSRIFSNGDLAFLILQMVYFPDMINSFKATRITNGTLCGINPCDPDEWTALAASLTKFGDRVLNTDYSGFDASCSELNWSEANDFQKLFYKNASDGNHEREFIMRKMLDYVMIYNSDGVDEYSRLSRSLPSGLYLTSWFGSYVNLRANYTACVSIRLKHEMSHKSSTINPYAINQANPADVIAVSKEVSRTTVAKAYGDDSVFATMYPDLYNAKTLFEELELLYGMIATNEVPDDKVDHNGYSHILDSCIIARGFNPVVINGRNKFVAPIRHSTLRKIQWSKKGATTDIEKSRIDSLLKEASFHGPTFHNEICEAIKEGVSEHLYYRSPFMDFSIAFESACKTEFLAFDGDEFIPMKKPEAGSSVFRGQTSSQYRGFTFYSLNGDALAEHLPRPMPQPTRTVGGTTKGRTFLSLTTVLMLSVASICISKSIIMKSGTEPGLGSKSVSAVGDVFRGQSSSSAMSMESSEGAGRVNHNTGSTIICDSSGVTCFTEAEGVIRRSAPTMAAVPMQHYEETIGQFVSRPQNLGAVTWSTGTAQDATLFFESTIGSYLASVTPWANKLVGYSLFKGTFVFRVELNAMKFQQGLLLIHYLPNYSNMVALETLYNKRVNTQMSHRIQHPHVIMNASDTAAEIRIPYVSPEDFYRLGGATGFTTPDWGRIQIDVLSPLKVGVGQTATAADLSIYGYWEDVIVTGPSIAQSSKKPMKMTKRSQSVQAKELVPAGPIGPGLMSVATVADTLSDIPYVGEYMAPLSWALRLMGNTASYFGWSKPRVNVTQTVVAEQTHRYIATSDGPCTAIPLAVIHDNSTEVATDHTSAGLDEMSLKYLLTEIPNLTSRFVWNSTDAVGASLLTRNIGPKNLYHDESTQTAGAFTAAYRSGGPLWYLGNVFDLWRGSIILHLKLVKTQFHSGKIMITFTPSASYSPPATTIANSTLSLRQIIDVREQDEIHMTLPYMVPMKYLNCFKSNKSLTINESYDSTMGRLDIVIINDLKAPDTVSQTIEFVEWYTAGDDFEYQFPSGPKYIKEGGAFYQSKAYPFIGQSGAGGQMIMEGGIAETKEERATSYTSKSCTGEYISSLKSLLQRLSYGTFNTALPNTKSLVINQFYISALSMSTITGILSVPSMYGDALCFLAPLYLYMKGSMRMYCSLPNSAFSNVHGMVQDDPWSTETTRAFVTGGQYTNATGVVIGVPIGGTTEVNPFLSPAPGGVMGCNHFQIPYYSQHPVAFSVCTTDNTYPGVDKWRPHAVGSLQSTGNFASNTAIGRSCGDDFQLSYFISCPSLLISY